MMTVRQYHFFSDHIMNIQDTFFWWGTTICTNEEYAASWRYTVDFLREKKSIHNILYAYNTDG